MLEFICSIKMQPEEFAYECTTKAQFVLPWRACTLAAALAGLTFQSWSVFAIGLLAGLIVKFHDGGIRLAARKRRR